MPTCGAPHRGTSLSRKCVGEVEEMRNPPPTSQSTVHSYRYRKHVHLHRSTTSPLLVPHGQERYLVVHDFCHAASRPQSSLLKSLRRGAHIHHCKQYFPGSNHSCLHLILISLHRHEDLSAATQRGSPDSFKCVSMPAIFSSLALTDMQSKV